MSYFLHIFYGILISFFALISPGMLNMSALKVRIDIGKMESLKFSFGASVVIFLQAGVALLFADYFAQHPSIIVFLEKAGVFVLFILALFFFILSKKKVNPKAKSERGNYFIKGGLMSALNMLSIPFYLAISIYLASKNKIIIKQPYIMLFVFGNFLGSMLLFYLYIYFAKIIAKKVAFIAKNINLVLSLIFIILGTIALIRIFP